MFLSLSVLDEKARTTAQSDRDHSALSTPGDHSHKISKERGFAVSLILFELVCLFFFALKFEMPSPEHKKADKVSTISEYPMYLDVHLMIFVGFGFLMTFLRRYSLSAISLNFIIAVLSLQWGIIVYTMANQIGEDHFTTKLLDIPLLINGDFAAETILISLGAVLGRTTPTQLVWMTFLEVIVYGGNEYLLLKELKITDVGGSVVIHTFGAFFGLAVSFMFGVPSAIEQEHNTSRYNSDMFAMIGTLLLWVYWPSFNAAFSGSDDFQRERAVISTVLCLSGSCTAAFAASKMLSHTKKIDMVHVQNATLAGGIAMGTCSNLAVCPETAIIIGLVVGVASVAGYRYVSPHLEREFRIADTCGVFNLHGMPGLVGGFAGAMVTFLPPMTFMETQGWYQLLAIVTSASIATLSGLIVGYFLSSKQFHQQQLKYEDEEWFSVPDKSDA
ncbi:putative blood group Rhesus C/E/D polypeptide, ammonium transporter AmtB-like protein [Plasmopara halstedii]